MGKIIEVHNCRTIDRVMIMAQRLGAVHDFRVFFVNSAGERKEMWTFSTEEDATKFFNHNMDLDDVGVSVFG